MNERIRELAEQAKKYALDAMIKITDKEQALKVYSETYDTKFAELIVRECYEHCKGQVLDKEVADTNELTYNDAVSDCANGLLQHFGVEE